MARPARKNERGLTLVETLVALAIVFIVFMGLMETGMLVLDYNINNTIRDEGVRVAEMAMEQTRNRPFTELQVLATTPEAPVTETRSIRGLSVGYNWWTTVTALNADTLRVAVDVTWTRNAWTPSGRNQRNYGHQLITLVRNR